jgi:glycosyltransferase involved in cell wall biosynthesis
MIKNSSSSKNLVILTTHFGINFSGGSTATHEIFVRLEDEFNHIIVVCNRLGNHRFKKVEFRLYNSLWDAYKILTSLDDKNTIYYGDFYNSVLFVWAKKRFYFTYHDNWPEMKNTSLSDQFRSIFYIPIYKAILKSAEKVIAVSKYKMNYITKYTAQAELVFNGFNVSMTKNIDDTKDQKKILMVGNIDKRKYQLAIKLFEKLGSDFEYQIHIFGRSIDKRVVDILDSYKFVTIMGFVQNIPYYAYNCLLHTSRIENLPLAICESVYCGTPVIAFNVGGISEVVKADNGILIDPFDFRQMKLSLRSILSGERGFSFRNNNLKNFDWELASADYLRILW